MNDPRPEADKYQIITPTSSSDVGAETLIEYQQLFQQ